MRRFTRENNRKKNRGTGLFAGLTVFFLAAGMAIGLSGCEENTGTTSEGPVTREVFAMDTIMDLTVYGENAGEAINQAVELIHQYDTLFSVTNPESDVAKINQAEGKPVAVSEETRDLLKRSLEVSEETQGIFDISIYPLVKVWGFTTGANTVPTKTEREAALAKVDYRKIQLLSDGRVQIEKGMELDLGAVAKGYLSQKLMELFQAQGVTSAIVSLGGNVQTIGKKPEDAPFVIGITNPADGTSIYGTLEAENKAVVTSGIYQRNFREAGKLYHHIMDKSTGMPAENTLASVTVVAEDGTTADALATALYVMGEEKAMEYQKNHPEIQLILIRKDGSCEYTSGLSFK